MNSENKISNFLFKEKLGKGSYGEVYRVQDKSKPLISNFNFSLILFILNINMFLNIICI